MAHKHPLTSGQMRGKEGGGWGGVMGGGVDGLCLCVCVCGAERCGGRRYPRGMTRQANNATSENKRLPGVRGQPHPRLAGGVLRSHLRSAPPFLRPFLSLSLSRSCVFCVLSDRGPGVTPGSEIYARPSLRFFSPY